MWGDIWDQSAKHNQWAPWLDNVREELQDVPRQSHININVRKVKTQLKRIPNWKAPGPEQVQGFWLKILPAYIAEL